MSLEAFMSAPTRAKPLAMNGNTEWAHEYAGVLKGVMKRYANNSERNLQRALGPSELGTLCDRQVVGKLSNQPVTNHVVDVWPSLVGTALHRYAEDAFKADNAFTPRWLTETRVWPWDDTSGSADLCDAHAIAVVDHKFLGKTSHEKIVANGCPHGYKMQLRLYGQGYRNKGVPIQRLVLAVWSRTSATIEDLYVWEEPWTDEVEQSLVELRETTERRRALAGDVMAGRVSIDEVATAPSDSECYFCPFYRPERAIDPGVSGCPGGR